MTRWLRRACLTALVALAVLGQSSCSAILDTNPYQCTVDADCWAKGEDFIGMGCSPELHACFGGRTFCRKNKDCTLAHNGEPWQCEKSSLQCKSLLGPECPTILGTEQDSLDDNVVVYGVEAVLSGPSAGEGKASIHALELARRDFAARYGGLPPVAPGKPKRPIVFVVCDGGAGARRATSHLLDDLHVPAIIGPLESASPVAVPTMDIVQRYTLVVSPVADVSSLANREDDDFFWRLGAGDKDFVRLYSAMVSELEIVLRAKGVVSDTKPMKVALFHRGAPLWRTSESLFLDALRFNGKSAAANLAATPPSYAEVDYGDGADAGALRKAQYDVMTFAPHVIIEWGLGETFTNTTEIERAWPATASYRPYYLMPPAAQTVKWSDLVTTDELRSRILGTAAAPPPDDPIAAAIRAKYDSEPAFKDDPTAVYTDVAAAYFDAAYLLYFATVAIGDAPLTGQSLVDGMRKLGPPGRRIDPTSRQSLTDAVTELQAGRKIDYFGGLGQIVFDDAGDFNPSPAYVWCVGPPSKSYAIQRTGWTLDKATGRLDGINTCFTPPAP